MITLYFVSYILDFLSMFIYQTCFIIIESDFERFIIDEIL